MFGHSWKWFSEFIVITNVGIMRFEGQYDSPKDVIKWDKDYKFVREKAKIDGRGNLISIFKQGDK